MLYDYRPILYMETPVDTTFAMYRTSNGFRRLAQPSIRVLPPLGARHLDFYWTRDRVPPDMLYYLRRVGGTSFTHMLHLIPVDEASH